jgi:transposase InsO family protein
MSDGKREWRGRQGRRSGLSERTTAASTPLRTSRRTFEPSVGIKAETTIPYTPKQNGKAERGNRTIEEKITCLLQDANGIDKSERGRYWAEALNTATYIINRLPTSTNGGGKTPYEAYYGSQPPLQHFRTFGSRAYVHDKPHRKHQPKTIDCIFLGYSDDNFGKKAYRLKAKSDGKILFSRDVTFDESLGLQRGSIMSSRV